MLGRRSAFSGLVVAGVSLAVCAVALLPARGHLDVPTVGLLFLLPVVLTAVLGDLWSALVASLGADLLVNFFFVLPYHTFVVQSPSDVVLLLVYLLVAAVISLATDFAVRYRATADELAGEAGRLGEVDRLRTALLAAVSHDLRTPLAGIKAAVSTLREPDVAIPEDERAELLRTVEASTDRLTALVGDLLSASRLQTGELSLHLAPVALDGVAAAALVATGAEAVLDVPDDLPLVLADPGLLEEAVVNLVRNATAADSTWPVRLSGRIRDGRGELAVIDRGPGVAERDWPALFTPFHRLGRAAPGSGIGLGLTVVKGFIEAMGGTVTPSHTPGGGLTMTLSLPLAEEDR
jgi:two-component system sensor histidine kinase KdpD